MLIVYSTCSLISAYVGVRLHPDINHRWVGLVSVCSGPTSLSQRRNSTHNSTCLACHNTPSLPVSIMSNIGDCSQSIVSPMTQSQDLTEAFHHTIPYCLFTVHLLANSSQADPKTSTPLPNLCIGMSTLQMDTAHPY